MTRLQGVLFAAGLVLPAGLVFPATPQSPAFTLESLEVEGVQRTSPEILLSESLLRQNESYTEKQMGEAMNRIRRLPFVIDVDFVLTRGSEEGLYQLVIQVEEAEWYFLGADLWGILGGQTLRFLDDVPPGVPGLDDSESWTQAEHEEATLLTAGVRRFFGSRGVASVSLTGETVADSRRSDQSFLNVGYAQFGMLGKGVSLGAMARISGSGEARRFGVETGVPLRGNHSLRLAVWASQGKADWWQGLESEERSHRADFEWRLDSRNDTLFARRGAFFSGRLRYAKAKSERPDVVSPHYPVIWVSRSEVDDEDLSARLLGTHFFSLSWRSSLSLSAFVEGLERTRTSTVMSDPAPWQTMASWDQLSGGARIGYLLTIWKPASSALLNELRWEAMASYSESHRRYHSTAEGPGGSWEENRSALASYLVLRNRWAVFRLGIVYSSQTFETR